MKVGESSLADIVYGSHLLRDSVMRTVALYFVTLETLHMTKELGISQDMRFTSAPKYKQSIAETK